MTILYRSLLKISRCEVALAELIMITYLLAFLVQVYYYLLVYSQLATYKTKDNGKVSEGVSVVIAARNEIDNLAIVDVTVRTPQRYNSPAKSSLYLSRLG